MFKRIVFVLTACTFLFLAGCMDAGPLPGTSALPAGTQTSIAPQPSAVKPNPSPTADETPVQTDGTENGADLQILFINVGRADSALVSQGGRHYLVDTGTPDSLPAIVSALRAMGVERLEGIFLSHTHGDHTGGLEGLLRLFFVQNIYASEITENKKDGTNIIGNKAQDAGKAVQRLKQGDEIAIGSASVFSVIGPVAYNAEDDNDNSMVLKLKSGSFSCLFTGDMQFAEEQSLLDTGGFSPVNVLKVGNHGNGDASSSEFIAAVKPEVAVISTDPSVDTDTPASAVLNELSKVKAKVFITHDSRNGILVKTPQGKVAADLYTAPVKPATADIVIDSIDRESELLVLRNKGKSAVDLTGWWLISERGGEMFVFPDGTVIQPGDTLSVSSGKKPPDADLKWDEKNVWHDKKSDTAILYDRNGNEAGREALP